MNCSVLTKFSHSVCCKVSLTRVFYSVLPQLYIINHHPNKKNNITGSFVLITILATYQILLSLEMFNRVPASRKKLVSCSHHQSCCSSHICDICATYYWEWLAVTDSALLCIQNWWTQFGFSVYCIWTVMNHMIKVICGDRMLGGNCANYIFVLSSDLGLCICFSLVFSTHPVYGVL